MATTGASDVHVGEGGAAGESGRVEVGMVGGGIADTVASELHDGGDGAAGESGRGEVGMVDVDQPTVREGIRNHKSNRELQNLMDYSRSGKADKSKSPIGSAVERAGGSKKSSTSGTAQCQFPSARVHYRHPQPPSGGWYVNLPAPQVAPLASYLREIWTGIGLHVSKKHTAFPPIQGYEFTVEPYDAEQQLQHTIRIENRRMTTAMTFIPNFATIAALALDTVQKVVGEDDLAIYDAHILRQKPRGCAGGASFSAHRDNHDNPNNSLLRYSFVIKLTADPEGATPSSMVVLEPQRLAPLTYGKDAGSGVLFRSQDKHTSVIPDESLKLTLKLVFFFWRASNGEAQYHDHINRPYFAMEKFKSTTTYVEHRIGPGVPMQGKPTGVATLEDVWAAAIPPPPVSELHRPSTRGVASVSDLIWSNPRGFSCCLKPELSAELVAAAEACAPKSIFPMSPTSSVEELVAQMKGCRALDNMTWKMTGQTQQVTICMSNHWPIML